MTRDELVEKLHTMREHGEQMGRQRDTMTMLFGLIFHEEIGTDGAIIAGAYDSKYGDAKKRVNPTIIQNGRKLAPFVEPRVSLVLKWRR